MKNNTLVPSKETLYTVLFNFILEEIIAISHTEDECVYK